jgi:gamma-glutamylputrescine oxidase
MNLSYWERDYFVGKPDVIVIGSGIVGLSCALRLKQQNSNMSILVLEKGILPSGASTKNAGFACFGSLTELIDDVEENGLDQMIALVESRWKGLNTLKNQLGEKDIDFQSLGGYELFRPNDLSRYPAIDQQIDQCNDWLEPIFNQHVFEDASKVGSNFGFSGVSKLIFNRFEGQINTGLMMKKLSQKCQAIGIQILNNVTVNDIKEDDSGAIVNTNLGMFSAKQLAVCTNAFAKQLLPLADVKPGRAQVLVTKPIENLKVKGTFHYDRGYYYFRNINNRVLIGGGRNIDLENETTTEFGLSDTIQQSIEQLLSEVILPNNSYEIDMRWSGIMGLGNSKKVIIERTSPHISTGIRLGGMGVAIGFEVGNSLSDIILNKL